MPSIHFSGETIALDEGESVLEALIRNGIEVQYGCQAGLCQSCVMVADSGSIPAIAQRNLNAAQLAQNYFLACQCMPGQDLVIRGVETNQLRSQGRVVEKRWLSATVLGITIMAKLPFRGGQYVTVWADERLGRSYSIASARDRETIDLHIKHYPEGKFSHWAAEQLREGDQIQVQGPMGLCFYTAAAEQAMLLAGAGTGLAPLLGVLRDAISNEHTGPIDLVLAGKTVDSFYLLDELKQLENSHKNLTLHFLVQEIEDSSLPEYFRQSDIYEYVDENWPSLAGYKIHLCGAPSLVQKMKKRSFLKGASMADIHFDAFLPFES